MIKKETRLSYLTFGQARVRGVTKKRWLRAVHIREAKARRKQRLAQAPQENVPISRIRRQVVFYHSNPDAPSINMYSEVRVITINPIFTDRGLRQVAEKYKMLAEKSWNITLNRMGIEQPTQLSPKEDLKLNDLAVHIELIHQNKKEHIIVTSI